MRTLVLYQSKTGNTQKYAEEIGNAVHADIMPLKKFKERMIDDYDTIVFGGWVMANKIQGLDSFLSHYEVMKDKNILIYSVGMSMTSPETRQEMISSNILDLYHVRYYQLRGSFDFNKLGFVHRMLMGHTINIMAAKENPDASQMAIAQLKEHPIEFHDYAGIDRIVSVLHRLEDVVATQEAQ